MQIETLRFGNIEVGDDKVINFEQGLPGFEDLNEYVLLSPDETRPIYWMQAVKDPSLALPVLSSFDILEDYSMEIPDDMVEELKLDGIEDLLVLNVAIIPEDISKMTANLAAPILMNVRLNIGKQIVIDSKEYPTRYPVFNDICNAMSAEGGRKTDAGTDKED